MDVNMRKTVIFAALNSYCASELFQLYIYIYIWTHTHHKFAFLQWSLTGMRSGTRILIAHYYYYYYYQFFFSFLFSQWQEEVGVVRLKNRDGDRRWLALTSRDKAIKGRGSRCCVYSNIRELAGKQGDYEKAQQLHSATWSLSRTEELRCSQPGSRKGLALLRPTAARFQPCSASVQPHRQLKISFRIISLKKTVAEKRRRRKVKKPERLQSVLNWKERDRLGWTFFV